MIRSRAPLAALAACAALAGCGVEAPPRPPEDPPARATPGVAIAITGTAKIGISGTH